MIDFANARLSLRRLGNNWAGGIDAVATLYCVFPARNLGYKQASLASSAQQNIFCNIGSCKCASTHNCLYHKSHPLRSGLPMMLVCIARDSVGARNHLHNHLIHNFTATFNLHMVSYRSQKNSALLLQI